MATKRASFSLEEEYQQLFRKIVQLTRRSMTDELRIMLDARAAALGLKPVQPVDPKFSAPSPETALALETMSNN